MAAPGSAAAWLLAAHAQQPERMRRIGILMNLAADDGESQARPAAFVEGLHQSGWIEGCNVRIDIRWRAGGVVVWGSVLQPLSEVLRR
jgi:putative ABC transport system substrate-binding protein